MSKLFKYACVALLLFTTAGCSWFSSNNGQKHYYQIFYNPEENLKDTTKKIVRIKTFEIDKVYKRYNLVYRISAHELFYYNTHFWAARPADMLTDLITSHIKKTAIFKEVITKLEKKPDFIITGNTNNKFWIQFFY